MMSLVLSCLNLMAFLLCIFTIFSFSFSFSSFFVFFVCYPLLVWFTPCNTIKEFCAQNWTQTWDKYMQGAYPRASEHRLTHQCFKSVWVNAMLHEGTVSVYVCMRRC